MESVDPVAGIVLSNSLSAAKAVAESRMLNGWWGDSPFFARRGRQIVVPPLYHFGAAVLVALDGDASPTVADSRILLFSSADAASRRPRRRALISAGR